MAFLRRSVGLMLREETTSSFTRGPNRTFVNKVILMGTVGKDAEMHTVDSKIFCTTFSLVTNYSVRDNDTGEWNKVATWHRVAVYGTKADFANRAAKKGAHLYLEGTLQAKKFTDKNGQAKTNIEVVIGPKGTINMVIPPVGFTYAKDQPEQEHQDPEEH
eukprot:TRINITY_DN1891_c0_g1_i5.p1 TRINITY_DN1891_c0_g1~~TRINITY_DN1891_c0_g1_i5.p1  ORF type:complete len:160 (-),score=27.89 TRINITY_DN1891_c0_g1_i5:164-643(-)